MPGFNYAAVERGLATHEKRKLRATPQHRPLPVTRDGAPSRGPVSALIPVGQVYPSLAVGIDAELRKREEGCVSQRLKGSHSNNFHATQGTFDYMKTKHPNHAIVWLSNGEAYIVWLKEA